MQTKEEALIEADVTELTNYWRERNIQMELDRQTINLVKTEAQKSDKTKWMDNEPKVTYDLSVNLLSSYPPRFRFPLTINFEDDERRKMNKAERLVIGIFRALNRQYVLSGRDSWERELCYWVCSGMAPVFAHVEQEGKDVVFYADIFDPMTVYPKWDNDGLAKLVRVYETSKITAYSQVEAWMAKGLGDLRKQNGLNERIEDFGDVATIKVVNWWMQKKDGDRYRTYNAITMNGRAVKPMVEAKFKHIPFIIGKVGIPDKMSANWNGRYCENIIAPNRDMYEYTNTMVSLAATIMAETAYPNIVSKTRLGQPVTDKMNKGYGEEIALKPEESLDLLKLSTTPQEVAMLMQWVNKQKQKGGFSDVLYGGVMFETSGFALSQLMATMKYKLAPYLALKDSVTSLVASELIEQYRDGGYPKITLDTVDPKNRRKGLSFVEEYSRGDVPERTYVEVATPLTSVIDKTQQILFARQALQEPQILSLETVWDEVIDIQDSDQEYERIIQDRVLRSPAMQQIAVIEQLRKKEKAYREAGEIVYADIVKGYIDQLMASINPQGQNTGTPASPPGISPEQMPPEMGAMSPDMMRAIAGAPPPSPNRPTTAGTLDNMNGRPSFRVRGTV